MVVSASEVVVGKSYTFSQLKDVVRMTSGLVTSEVKNDRFVTIKCAESGVRKIVDLSVLSRIELIDS